MALQTDPGKLLAQALTLPPPARAALAASLLESLEGQVDEGVEESWSDEIRRRWAEVEAGTAELVAWEEAGRRIIGK